MAGAAELTHSCCRSWAHNIHQKSLEKPPFTFTGFLQNFGAIAEKLLRNGLHVEADAFKPGKSMEENSSDSKNDMPICGDDQLHLASFED